MLFSKIFSLNADNETAATNVSDEYSSEDSYSHLLFDNALSHLLLRSCCSICPQGLYYNNSLITKTKKHAKIGLQSGPCFFL